MSLLNKIVISVCGTINFFCKHTDKNNELKKKGEKVSDSPKIIKIDKYSLDTALNFLILKKIIEGENNKFLKQKKFPKNFGDY